MRLYAVTVPDSLPIDKDIKVHYVDVLVISDFEFPIPKTSISEEINKEKALGTRFFALQIGHSNHKYHKIMDRIWTV